MLLILGYLAAVIIGILLGLIGGGGSILTVPVLVYLLGVPPVLATAYSLFIVGISALVGASRYIKKRIVSFKALIYFGIPSVIAVFLTRTFVVPEIPNELFTIGSRVVKKDAGIMFLFSILMLLASFSMIKKEKVRRNTGIYKPELEKTMLIAQGTVVGSLTAIVGIGGGFLIIPAIIQFARLEIKTAIGTSLFLIACNSLIGFSGDIRNILDVDWKFLIFFSSSAILGIFIGEYLSSYIPGEKLKPTFGIFILVMGIFIISSELLRL